MNFKQKIINFFRGTYGNDTLNTALFCLYFVICVINAFVKSFILSFVAAAVAVYALFRMFSKKIYKRKIENDKFVAMANKVKNRIMQAYNAIRLHNKFVYKNCPKCNARLRMTRKRGKHTVKCPLCQNEFEVKIL